MSKLQSFVTVFTFLAISLNASHADWPQWRGPGAQGHAPEGANLPTKWSEEDNITWKTEIPGRGHSSPIVAEGKVWITTAFETKADPKKVEERLKENTGSQPLTILEEAKFHLLGFDAATGEELHNIHLFSVKDPQWVHRLNSYASPTSVYDDGRIYCHFGSNGSACVDIKTGEVVWTNQELEVKHENGPGSSPVLYGDVMIFHMDGSDEQYLTALSKSTGAVEWTTKRSGKMNDNPQLKKAYSTPIIEIIDDKPVVVSPAANWLYGYDPATGKELWRVEYGVLGFSNVARPVSGNGMIYFPTCFLRSEMLAVKYDGVEEPEIAWRYGKNVPKTPSPILVDDLLYMVSEGGIVTCLDAKSGEEIYRERLGGNFSSSPLHSKGKIFFHSQEGITTIIQAGKDFKVLSKNELEGAHMASAAVDGNALILRTDKALYRIEE